MLFKIIFIAVVLKYSSGQGKAGILVLRRGCSEFTVGFALLLSITICKIGWLHYGANWFDANIFCRDHGMQLATANSYDEVGDINQLLQQIPPTFKLISESYGEYIYDNIWISATDLAEEGHFTWFSTGQVVSYTAWAMGHPFRADPNYQFDEFGQPIPKEIYENSEDCVQIGGETRSWENANCTNLNYFLCERV